MDINQIWSAVKVLLEEKIGYQAVNTWFDPVNIKEINTNRVVIYTPNRFFSNWLKDHYYGIIYEALSTLTRIDNIEIEFIDEDNKKLPKKSEPIKTDIVKRDISEPLDKNRLEKNNERRRSILNPRYTFDTFIVGSSNQFAHAASLAVAEALAKSYNPLFLYSDVGLGKTHLLNAIGNFVIKKRGGTKTTYISAEQFTNEVINSIRYDRMFEFRQRYRNIDMLMIDDIQFIAGKERTQEEFFHTFNTLYEAGRQIVVSSDKFPKGMLGIEERLRSRFEWGLIADIQPPDLETKIAILTKKADLDRITLPLDVATFLATNIKTNIRELEGSLNRLGAFSSLTGERITIDMAKRVLKDKIDEKRKITSIDDIQQVVSSNFHIKISDMKSKKRNKNLVYPRQISMYIARDLTGLSFPEIGRHFGGKDHTTVIHACKQIEKAKERDKELEKTIKELIKTIKEQ